MRIVPRILLSFLIVALLALLAALFLRPPEVFLRAVSAACASAIMRGPAVTERGPRAAATHLAGAYIQASLSSYVAHRVVRPQDSDEEALFRIVVEVRDHVLSQDEFDHIPRAWPALVSGLAYCDQINAAVATIASKRFDVAQLYAIYDPVKKLSPHTIGRVWSSRRKEWLYFDAYYSRPLIFTRNYQDSARFLEIVPSTVIPSRGSPDLAMYSWRGWALTTFEPTFGGYLWARAYRAIGTRLGRSSPATEDLPEALLASDSMVPELSAGFYEPPAAIPAAIRVEDAVFERVSRDFMSARVSDLLGAPSQILYERIASDPRNAEDDRAAHVAAIASRLASRDINSAE